MSNHLQDSSVKEKYMKRNFYTTLVLFFFLVVATIFLFSYLFSEGKDCQLNPIQFGVDAIAKNNKQDVKCDCLIENYEVGHTPTYFTIKSYT